MALRLILWVVLVSSFVAVCVQCEDSRDEEAFVPVSKSGNSVSDSVDQGIDEGDQRIGSEEENGSSRSELIKGEGGGVDDGRNDENSELTVKSDGRTLRDRLISGFREHPITKADSIMRMLLRVPDAVSQLETEGGTLTDQQRRSIIRRMRAVTRIWKQNDELLNERAKMDPVYRKKYSALIPHLQHAEVLSHEDDFTTPN